MNKKLFCILLISFSLIASLYAQEEVDKEFQKKQEVQENLEEDSQEIPEEAQENTQPDRYRTHEEPEKGAPYIESFGNKFSLSLSAYINRLYSNQTYHDYQIQHTANLPLDIGFGFLYGNFGLEFRQQTSFFYNSDYSKTRAQEGKLSYYAGNVMFEIQIKDYKSFHFGGEETDLHLKYGGISGRYIWNGEEYSWRAAFDLYEKQLRPSGSLLLGGDVFYMMAESHLPASCVNLSGSGNIPVLYKKRYILATPNIGYAYTWVYKNNLFIASSPSIGPGIAHELSETKNYPALSLSFRGAVGYHWKDISFIISLNVFGTVIFLNDAAINSFEGSIFKCSVTKRF